MPTPAERYAAARKRAGHPALTDFRAGYGFELDDFQVSACQALEEGRGVLVAAPTGAGKTVVGEFAVHLALATGRKCFYTTPIKALSNQKYADLVATHGAASVGLLTGDNAVNGDAPVVVMTTEVLRNMLYTGSATLADLGFVVMDEVHYLADRFRGAVWEEVIIHLPQSVTLVSLSATVSNAEEFADWLITVRGDTAVVVSERRPVPLWQHMLVGGRLYDLFDDGLAIGGDDPAPDRREVDKRLVRAVREQDRFVEPIRRGGQRPRWRPPRRPDVVERLDRAGLLPAIVFIFSRVGCEQAVRQCVYAGLHLVGEPDRVAIRDVVERRTAEIPAEDLTILGYWEWLDGLERGVAAHHAGMIPTFKETVEELFVRGLVKVVFATETLALGINMPARSVVLERMVKFDGDSHADLTAGEYTQLTGRAGRRGIDIEGHAVVQWSPGVDPAAVAGLASTRTYPLRSSFRPSYNMAVNLVGQVGRVEARRLLESSFAQFQADRAVVGLARQVRRNTETLTRYAGEMRCDFGDFAEYADLRARISERESMLSRHRSARRRAETVEALERLKPGDVIRVPSGRRRGLAVVIDPGKAAGAEPRPLVLNEDRWAGRLSLTDFPTPVEPLGRARMPRHFNHRSAQQRRDLAATLRNLGLDDDPGGRVHRRGDPAPDDEELISLRRQLRAHPCHACPDREEHARWAERARRLRRETDSLNERIHSRTDSLARVFDQVCALLAERGYLPDPPAPADGAPTSGNGASTTGNGASPAGSASGPFGNGVLPNGDAAAAADSAVPVDGAVPVEGAAAVPAVVTTEAGRRLSRLWSESDLLIAECLRTGAWADLAPAELAAVAACVLYESRQREGGPADVTRLPAGPVREAVARTLRIWADLETDERRHGLAITREPDLGFCWAAYRWARGEPLNKVLQTAAEFGQELSAGDFVRWCRQLVDLLGQLGTVAPSTTGAAARQAVQGIRRGVVAFTGLT